MPRGKKQSKQMPGWLRERGLDAYEYQCGKGVTVGEATAGPLGRPLLRRGLPSPSTHPTLSTRPIPNRTARPRPQGMSWAGLPGGPVDGAERVVVHTGAIQKRTPPGGLGHRAAVLPNAAAPV